MTSPTTTNDDVVDNGSITIIKVKLDRIPTYALYTGIQTLLYPYASFDTHDVEKWFNCGSERERD